MTDPKPLVADIQPRPVQLQAGRDYYFCTCGRSGRQPFCDGSHGTSGFEPLKFTAERDGTAALCTCKQSQRFPYCDGSHQRLTADQVGKAAR